MSYYDLLKEPRAGDLSTVMTYEIEFMGFRVSGFGAHTRGKWFEVSGLGFWGCESGHRLSSS